MSQSPDAASAAADRIDLYQQGWRALSRMIAEGRSFSGHERNCCFLNTGDGRFADISAASELDFLDDARAVAVADWDLDGRVDFWVTNRTAPRVRYLRNDTRNDCHFVAVRLEGVTCNRDAIGARVELFLDDAPDHAFVKQLSAGDGYLAQSSKWIHFGIGTATQVDRLVVHWPGGGEETFRGLSVDRHYKLVQGSAAAKPRGSSRAARNERSPEVSPPVKVLHRTVIVGKVPLPHAEYQDWHGNLVPFAQHLGRPLLVNLWSPSCLPCLTELSSWTKEADRLRAVGLDVVALCVDSLLHPARTQLARAEETLDKIGFEWSAGVAQQELVQTLELMHHTYLELKQDLPLPSSFLLDGPGRLAVIYKGPVPISVLLADVAALDADPKARRSSAVSFPGRWASKPFAPDPEPIVRNLDKLGRTDNAIEYARHCISAFHASDTPVLAESREIVIDLNGVLGELLLKQGQREDAGLAFDRALDLGDNAAAIHRDVGQSYMAHNMPAEALRHLAAALVEEPDDAELLYNLGLAELATRQPASAIPHLRRSLELVPDDANVCFQLANALHATGQTKDALIHYREALQLRPGWPFATNNLAWILATHPDASIRDGHESVGLAEALCQADDRSNPSWLATLAAAYAEVGRFDDAVRTNERAAKLAESQGKEPLANRLRDRTAAFRSRRSVRE